MKIKELEQILDIPRATIRFYEKCGLINPERNSDNDYREYTDLDVSTLKRIVVLRKIGFSISDIESLLDGSSEFDELLDKQINSLLKQKEEVEGALSICEEMRKSSLSIENFDEDYYWNVIKEKESEGFTFFDHISTSLKNALYASVSQIEYSPGHGPRTPDLLWNPLRKTTNKINSFWTNHSLLHLILIVLMLLLSLLFVLYLGLNG